MATFSVLREPNFIEPAYQNSIAFVVNTNFSTQLNFKYLFDVYSGEENTDVNTFETTVTTYPRTNGTCVFSPHYVLSNLVTYNVTPFIETFVLATNSMAYYNIEFGMQYNPVLTYATASEIAGYLVLHGISPTNPLLIGDVITIDKNDKSVNPQYDGTASIIISGPTAVLTDIPVGVTYSFPVESGSIINLVRRDIQPSGVKCVYNGTRQYEEIAVDFQALYEVDPSSSTYEEFLTVYEGIKPIYYAPSLYAEYETLSFILSTQSIADFSGSNPLNVISNGNFASSADWTLTNFLGSTASIGSGKLNYYDNVSGDGTSYAVQTNVLSTGVSYTVQLTTSNNNFTLVSAGDENNTYVLTNAGDGTFTVSFIATGNDFWIEMASAGGVTQGVDIDNVTVTYIANSRIGLRVNTFGGTTSTHLVQIPLGLSGGSARFDVGVGPGNLATYSVINALTDSYEVYLENSTYAEVITDGDFASVGDWVINDYLGSTASIGGGVLTYIDEVTGDGMSTITQPGVLTPGTEYNITLTTSSNNFVLVEGGDELNTYLITNDGNGTFTISFTASGNDFWLVLSSAGGVTQGVIVDNVSVTTNAESNRITEIRTYEIQNQCREYDLIRLAFLNKLGGIDYWTFNLVSKYKSRIERDKIQRVLQYNYKIGDRGHEVVGQKIFEEWTINSDYLTDDQALFIRELIESPEVYLLSGTDIIPLIITNDSWDFKSTLNDQLIQYELKFVKAYDIISNV